LSQDDDKVEENAPSAVRDERLMKTKWQRAAGIELKKPADQKNSTRVRDDDDREQPGTGGLRLTGDLIDGG
jgi:hypothetical protein